MIESENEPSPRSGRGTRRAARRKRLIIWSGVAVALLVAIFAAKPTYHWLKARRAAQFAAEGEALASAGKLAESAAKYRAALQLDPVGYRPLRGAARLASKSGRREAVDLWEQVVRLPQATVADRQDYAAALLQHRRFAAAEKVITELLRIADTRTLLLASRYSSRTGDEIKAIAFARAAVSRSPQDPAVRFELAQLLASSIKIEDRTEARAILWTVVESGGGLKQAAVEALARSPELSAEESERVLAALRELPPDNVTDGLLGAELQLKLHPENSAQIYDEAAARWSRRESPDLVELVHWLNFHREATRVLALIPPERAIASEPLLLSRLDALASSARWSEVDELLARQHLVDPAVAEAFRARSAQGRGATGDADAFWNRAIGLAASNPATLRFVANFAEQSGATTAALRAYEQLARHPDEAAAANRHIERLLQQTGDTIAQRAAAERLLKLTPDDPNAQDHLAYLNLLTNLDVKRNAALAKELATKYPTRLAYRVTAALGCLREHNAAGALAQFNAPAPIDWARTPPPWRAVYAAALSANDRGEDAKQLIAAIPVDRLAPEERALIDAR